MTKVEISVAGKGLIGKGMPQPCTATEFYAYTITAVSRLASVHTHTLPPYACTVCVDSRFYMKVEFAVSKTASCT